MGFLSEVERSHSRVYSVAIDTLAMGCEITTMASPADVIGPAATGTYIHGMFMEGGRINPQNGYLEEPSNVLVYEAVPVICLTPVVEQQFDAIYRGFYMCPLYQTSLRQEEQRAGAPRNLFARLPIPSKEPETRLCHGCAMLCSPDNQN